MDYYNYNQWKLAYFHVPWCHTSYEVGKRQPSLDEEGSCKGKDISFHCFTNLRNLLNSIIQYLYFILLRYRVNHVPLLIVPFTKWRIIGLYVYFTFCGNGGSYSVADNMII